MANATRILFVADEVAPFSSLHETAQLVRTLPEQLQETGDFEVRIMMPRYGTISERRNRLHEVIRLSGTEVDIGSRTETLKVKVASIPGIRLQVYFMDNAHYFKRKGVYAGKQGETFSDNLERALFFGRSALETIRKLGWGPDIVHGFGWMSGFVPLLLRTEFATDPLFENVKTIFTPNNIRAGEPISDDFIARMELSEGSRLLGRDPNGAGVELCEVAVYPPSVEPAETGSLQFAEENEENPRIVRAAYEQVLSEVAA